MKFSLATLVLVVVLATTNAASLSGEEDKVENQAVVETGATGDEVADVQLEGEDDDDEWDEDEDEDEENVWLRDDGFDGNYDEDDEFEDGEHRYSEDDEEDEYEFDDDEDEEDEV